MLPPNGKTRGKATALQQPKVLRGGLGFDLGHQLRFANASPTAEQCRMPSAAFHLINELVEGGQIGCAPD
jgi:hypothetical protein